MIYSTYPRRHPQDFADIQRAIEKFVLPGLTPVTPILDQTSIIRTQGSCFAENLHNAILQWGFQSRHLSFAEVVNSPLANRVFYDRVAGRGAVPFHPTHGKLFPDDLLEQIRVNLVNEDLIVFTVGLAGCWHDVEGKIPTIDADPTNLSDASFKWMSVSENAEQLLNILDILHDLNSKLHVVLTLSPVPLNRAFGQASAVVADCLSKSTLRVAISEVMSTARPNVSYWPSFEIVRWLGSHLPPVFGGDDGLSRHVSKDLVDVIIKLFMKYYAGTEVESPNVRSMGA